MARNTQARSVTIPYRVGIRPRDSAPPAESIRAVYDELSKVAQALADYDRPVVATLSATDTLAVGAAPAFERIFDEGVDAEWIKPEDTFDPVTGIWTCPQEGLYQVYAKAVIEPLNAPANKSYVIELRGTIDRLNDWIPDGVATSYGSGLDDQYVTAITMILSPFARGDRLWFDARAIPPTKTGNELCTCTLQISRQSGIGSTR